MPEVNDNDPSAAREREPLSGRRPSRILSVAHDRVEVRTVRASHVELRGRAADVEERDPLPVRGPLRQGVRFDIRGKPQQAHPPTPAGRSYIDGPVVIVDEDDTSTVRRPHHGAVARAVRDPAAHPAPHVHDGDVPIVCCVRQPSPVRRPQQVRPWPDPFSRLEPRKPNVSSAAARGLEHEGRGAVIEEQRLCSVRRPGDVCLLRKIQELCQPTPVGVNGVERLATNEPALEDDRPSGPPVTAASRCERRDKEHGHEAGTHHSRRL